MSEEEYDKNGQQVWDDFTMRQKDHFLKDHKSEFSKIKNWLEIISLDFSDLPNDVQKSIIKHVAQGKYKFGATVKPKSEENDELMGGQPNTSKPSGYKLISSKGNEIVVSDDNGKTKEKYRKSNGFSGYTLHYKGNQYEFVSSSAKGSTVKTIRALKSFNSYTDSWFDAVADKSSELKSDKRLKELIDLTNRPATRKNLEAFKKDVQSVPYSRATRNAIDTHIEAILSDKFKGEFKNQFGGIRDSVQKNSATSNFFDSFNQAGSYEFAKGGGFREEYSNTFKEVSDIGMEQIFIRKFGTVSTEKVDNIELLAVATIKDLEEYISEDELPKEGNFELDITLVPTKKHLSKKHIKSADSDNNSISNNTIANIVNYMGGLNYEPQDKVFFKTFEDAKKYLLSKELNDKISAQGIMSGFIMDNNYNRAGQSNWDYLAYMTGEREKFATGGGVGDNTHGQVLDYLVKHKFSISALGTKTNSIKVDDKNFGIEDQNAIEKINPKIHISGSSNSNVWYIFMPDNYATGGLIEGDSIIVHNFGMMRAPKQGSFVRMDGKEAIVIVNKKEHRVSQHDVSKFSFECGGNMKKYNDGGNLDYWDQYTMDENDSAGMRYALSTDSAKDKKEVDKLIDNAVSEWNLMSEDHIENDDSLIEKSIPSVRKEAHEYFNAKGYIDTQIVSAMISQIAADSDFSNESNERSDDEMTFEMLAELHDNFDDDDDFYNLYKNNKFHLQIEDESGDVVHSYEYTIDEIVEYIKNKLAINHRAVYSSHQSIDDVDGKLVYAYGDGASGGTRSVKKLDDVKILVISGVRSDILDYSHDMPVTTLNKSGKTTETPQASTSGHMNFRKGGVAGSKHVSVTKGNRLPHGYKAVKGLDRNKRYSRGYAKVNVDKGWRLPKGYEVEEGAYNMKYRTGGGMDAILQVGDMVKIMPNYSSHYANEKGEVVKEMPDGKTYEIKIKHKRGNEYVKFDKSDLIFMGNQNRYSNGGGIEDCGCEEATWMSKMSNEEKGFAEVLCTKVIKKEPKDCSVDEFRAKAFTMMSALTDFGKQIAKSAIQKTK